MLWDNKYFYEFNDENGNNERTKQRLIQIDKMGLIEIGIASFGIRGIMSGLTIEKIWYLNNEDWNSYIDWIEELKEKKQ